jgi:hypothetical protein
MQLLIDWIISMYPYKVDFWNNVTRCPKKLVFRKKSLLIRSHENRSLLEMSTNELEKRHDLHFGRSKKRFDVLLIRDPFNLFASRLQQQLNQGFNQSTEQFIMGHPKYKYGAHKPEQFVEIWKEHSKEYLGLSSYLTNNKVTINYNRWFIDQNYRREIAEALELNYKEDSLNNVLGKDKAGGGSSFDFYDYVDKASQMKVLERWKKMSDNENYRSLFKDREVWTLSYQIFGEISETECLRS